MEKDKLICPVKRLNKSSVDLKIDLLDDDMNIKVNINTKNIIKSAVNFINRKFKQKEE